MKGDFTRSTFRPEAHYRAVYMQQGRVALDADWNEQVDIRDHLDRIRTADAVGAAGGPAGDALGLLEKNGTLCLTKGRYYVDGILCENDAEVAVDPLPDLPGEPLPTKPGLYSAYLDVWSEHVTALDTPGLREPALGGPDTTTRARTVWQVRVTAGEKPVDPATPERGRLKAWTAVGYGGRENQLYRVEILDGGDATTGTPTFVWSRENGSVAARLTGYDKLDVLTIDAPGRDDRLGFTGDDWVEVVSPDRARRGEAGWLAQLKSVKTTELTVAKWRAPRGVTSNRPSPEELNLSPGAPAPRPVVRRWDSNGAVPVKTDAEIELEAGVWIQFTGGRLRPGDYWLIPARSASGNAQASVLWPRSAVGKPESREPLGIEHHYAALALVERSAAGWKIKEHRRTVYPPLSTLARTIDKLEAARALVVVGGDGQVASTDAIVPQPVRVLVRRGDGPATDVPVRFAVGSGSVARDAAGLAAGSTSVEAVTGSDGGATCRWRLGAGEPVQQLTVSLVEPGAGDAPASVTITATRSPERARALRVTGAVLLPSQEPLAEGATISVTALAAGVGVVLDRPAGPGSVAGGPVLRVVLDMPFPFSEVDQRLWKTIGAVGTTPLTLDASPEPAAPGASAPGRTSITWRPTEATRAFLTTRLFAMMTAHERGDSLVGRLVLDGRAIRAAEDAGVRGEDYAVRFLLVPSVDEVVVLPVRNGRLSRRPKLRETLEAIAPTQQVPRDLPTGTTLTRGADPDADPDAAAEAAEAAAAVGFDDHKDPRSLVLLVEPRLEPAANSLKNALVGIKVTLDLVSTKDKDTGKETDIATAITERSEKGPAFDGVIVTRAQAAALAVESGQMDSLRKAVVL